MLDHPSRRPVRTALGVATLTFYAVLLFAGAQDIWSQRLEIKITDVIWTFRILVFVLPTAAGLFAWKLCRDLRAGGRPERLAEATEPPRAPSERGVPVAGVSGATAPPPVRRGLLSALGTAVGSGARRMGGVLFALVVLAVLGRTSRHPRAARPEPASRSGAHQKG